MFPILATGTPDKLEFDFAEVPYRTASLTCSTVAQHQPDGSSGRGEVAGVAGAGYLACQSLGGSFPLAANLANCSASHLLCRSAKMRSSILAAGSTFGW